MKIALIWPDPDEYRVIDKPKDVRNYDEDAPPLDLEERNRCRYCKEKCKRAATTEMFKDCENPVCMAKQRAQALLRYRDTHGGGVKGAGVSHMPRDMKIKPARSGKK